MGDVNQFEFVSHIAPALTGPYLEIGSRNYGNTQDLRAMFKSCGEYVGVDMSDGDGVDYVVDLTRPFSEIDAALHGRRFGTIFCLSVLEHCDQPFAMAANMTRLLAPGGKVVISAPFAWKFHGYPSDYWRFTHEGIKKLFPEIAFDEAQSFAVTSREGEFLPADEDLARIPISSGYYRKKGQWLRAMTVGLLQGLCKLGLFNWLGGYRYLMPPTNVMMVGEGRTPALEKTADGKTQRIDAGHPIPGEAGREPLSQPQSARTGRLV